MKKTWLIFVLRNKLIKPSDRIRTKSSETNCKRPTLSKEKTTKTAKGTNIIRLPISELKYLETVKEPICFRQWLDGLNEKYKLLFDADLSKSYQFHDIRYSKKMDFPYHRINLLGQIYNIHPSFIMPYWSGKVEDCREGIGIMLYLRGTSLDSITACFGDNQQKWLDRVNHLGRFSIVGTTVKNPSLLS